MGQRTHLATPTDLQLEALPTSDATTEGSIARITPRSRHHKLSHHHKSSTSTESDGPTSQPVSPLGSTPLSLLTLSPSSSDVNAISTVNSGFLSSVSVTGLYNTSVTIATPLTASTLVSPAFTAHSSTTLSHPPTPSKSTPAPSQSHDVRTPVIVVCTCAPFILALAIFFFIRRQRRKRHLHKGKARYVLGIGAPPINPMTGGSTSFSNNVNRLFTRAMGKRQEAQRDQQAHPNDRTEEINRPDGPLRPGMEQQSQRGLHVGFVECFTEVKQQIATLCGQMQQLNRQVEHLQGRVVREDVNQGPSNHGDPPAYVRP